MSKSICQQCGKSSIELETPEQIMLQILFVHDQENRAALDGKTDRALERRNLKIALKRMLSIALKEQKEMQI